MQGAPTNPRAGRCRPGPCREKVASSRQRPSVRMCECQLHHAQVGEQVVMAHHHTLWRRGRADVYSECDLLPARRRRAMQWPAASRRSPATRVRATRLALAQPLAASGRTAVVSRKRGRALARWPSSITSAARRGGGIGSAITPASKQAKKATRNQTGGKTRPRRRRALPDAIARQPRYWRASKNRRRSAQPRLSLGSTEKPALVPRAFRATNDPAPRRWSTC